jgi:CMP-N-acetylneuraminic acid synthetase
MDASTLKSAMQLLEEKQADAVVPVTRFSYPIHRSLQIKEGVLEFNWPEYRSVRSQDLPVSYHDVGLFYALKTDLFLHTKQIFTSNTRPMVLPEYSVQDIDTEEDWITAEMKYSILQQSKIHLNV